MVSFDATRLQLECIVCGRRYEFNPFLYRCPRCGGLLDVTGYRNPVKLRVPRRSIEGVWRYREALPEPPDGGVVSLGEGGTPLVSLDRGKAWVKFEGGNPTGSFKDRGMSVASSIARWSGARLTVAASTGNTAASMAAYSARAGLKPLVVLPRGGVAPGKLFQAILHGSVVVEVSGSFDRGLSMVLELLERKKGLVYSMNSVNPVRLEGQKTIAYEIVEDLGDAPDHVVVPVGNAGNISAIWKGFKELHAWGYTSKLPRMIGVQAEGSAPLVAAWRSQSKELAPVEKPETIASAIRIGSPVNWRKALKALEESGGLMLSVSDQEIMEALKEMARHVGLGVEPSSAAPYAALKRLLEDGEIPRDDVVVLIATGHALKDPGIASHLDKATTTVSSVEELEELAEALARGSQG